MGSTFPLLDIEETRFSRVGVTAEIFATGFRPLSSTSAKAATAASSRKIKIRFRNLRSIFSYPMPSGSLFCRKAHHRPSAPSCSFLFSWLGALRPVGAEGLHSNNSRTAFSRAAPVPCFVTIKKDAPQLPGDAALHLGNA